MSQQTFDIQETMVHRFVPNYMNEVETLNFSNEQEFKNWFKAEACSHACWAKKRTNVTKRTAIEGALAYNSANHYKAICWKCDRFGPRYPQKTSAVEPSKKRQRTSPKVGCTALIDVYYMLDGKIKVVYKWVHQNHDPSCVEDLAKSRLPVEVRG
jgi:hypothetical protein